MFLLLSYSSLINVVACSQFLDEFTCLEDND